MKKKTKIFLITISVVFGLVVFNTTDAIKSLYSTNTVVKDTAVQFSDFLTEKNEEIISVLVYLKDQVDYKALNREMDKLGASLKDRHETIVIALQNTAYCTQSQLVQYLKELQSKGLVIDFH